MSPLISLSETNTVVSWGYFLFIFDFLIFFCVLPACMFMNHMCSRCPQRPKEDVGSPVSELETGVSHHVGAGTKPYTLQEQQVF